MRIKIKTFAVFLISLIITSSGTAGSPRQENIPTPAGKSSLEALKSLPYLIWVSSHKTIEKRGVTIHDPAKSWQGLNLYNPRNLSTAYLIDTDGNVLNSWSARLDATDSWHHVELCRNGDLLAIVKDEMLIRLDWDSNLLWVKRLRFHHDIAIGPDNDIYSIIRKNDSISFNGQSIPILNDYLILLSPDGEIKKEIPVFDLVKDQITAMKYEAIVDWIEQSEKNDKGAEIRDQTDSMLKNNTPPDLFHTNTIEILDREIKGVAGRGDLLISIRELDLVAIIDPDKETIVWSWGAGILDKQHHPTALPNGNILIFDNGVSRDYSRIVEIDPRTGEIVWEYKADPPQEFYSVSRGACQRLPNGNTLITESDKGRVFEIAPGGDTVWEFYNPEILVKTGERSAIYRMTRITHPERYHHLKSLTGRKEEYRQP